MLNTTCFISELCIYVTLFYICYKYLGKLKSYVCNKTNPEASIANSFLADECVVFCSRYIGGFSTKHNKSSRNDDSVDQTESTLFGQDSSAFPPVGKPLGKSSNFNLTELEKLQVHRLFNCAIVNSYLK
jgi:hypothetical protein